MQSSPPRRRRVPSAQPTDDPFVAWLTRALETRRISVRTLAARAGLDNSTLSRILRGESSPSLTTVRRLAETLGEDPPLKMTDRPQTAEERIYQALVADPTLSPRNRERVMRVYLRLRDRAERRPD